MASAAELKQYFWYVFGIMGVVFFWVGVWDGIGSLPYIQTYWISILAGLGMLALSGFIFRGNPLWGRGDKIESVLHRVHSHPQKHEFHIKYLDKLGNKEILVNMGKVKKIEKGFMVIVEQGRELFVPPHRITEILHQGKTHWKAKH